MQTQPRKLPAKKKKKRDETACHIMKLIMYYVFEAEAQQEDVILSIYSRKKKRKGITQNTQKCNLD